MSTGQKLIALMNDEKNLGSTLKNLRGQGYEIRVAHHLGELIKMLEIFEPTAILISWNIKKTNVRLMNKLMSDKLGIPCIVFAEELGTKTSVTLTNSGLPHQIQAPVSAGAIHMKVEKLISGNKVEQKEIFHFDKLVVVQPEDIPGGASWELMQNQNVVVGEHTVWRGTYHDEKTQTKKLFYYKGSRAPSYNEEEKGWDGFDSGGGPILMQERPHSDAYNMIQTQTESKLMRAVQAGTVNKEFEVITKQQLVQRKERRSWADSVKQLQKVFATEVSSIQQDPVQSQASVQQTKNQASSLDLNTPAEKTGHVDFDLDAKPDSGQVNKSELSKKENPGSVNSKEGEETASDVVADSSDLNFIKTGKVKSDLNILKKDEEKSENQIISKGRGKSELQIAKGETPDSLGNVTRSSQDEDEVGRVKALQEIDENGDVFQSGSDALQKQNKKESLFKSICREVLQGIESLITSESSILHIAYVNTSRFKGFLALALPKDKKDVLAAFTKNLEEKLKERGEPLLENISWGNGNRSLGRWAMSLKRLSEFSFKGNIEGIETFCWYVPYKELPVLSEFSGSSDKKLTGVPISKCIRTNAQVDFDLFINLEKNQKVIHYLKSGGVMSEKICQRLLSHQLPQVYFPSDQYAYFMEYYFFNFVLVMGSDLLEVA